MNTFIFTIICLSVLGLILSFILYFVAQKFKIVEDPRIDDVQAILPGANCGGCGYAGCRAFAEALVNAESLESMYCPVGSNKVMQSVADYLGVKVEEKIPQVAVVRCNGTCDNRVKTSNYDGYSSCAVMANLYAGDTDCRYGCLGQGDCELSCKFDAIKMDPRSCMPEVDEEKCTACGACVKACPNMIIELRNKGLKNRRIYVSCINKDKGGVAKKACVVACIGCTKCQKVCPYDAVTMANNLAYIDYNKCKLCRKCVVECPTRAIWEVNFPVRVPRVEKVTIIDQK